jgi:signal transduction histidine kinase
MTTEGSPVLVSRGGVGTWVRRLGVPVDDRRFWVIQALLFAIDTSHTVLEHAGLLVSDSELYLLSVSVFLIPIVYAGFNFGLRGAVPTVLWAVVLSIPEISEHDRITKIGIFTQFAIVMAIAVIVAVRVDREKAAARATEDANRQLSRLNATASAVAGSLDLDHVVRRTLRAELDPKKEQIVWIRLNRTADFAERTDIDASGVAVPAELNDTQEELTAAACRDGQLESDDPTRDAAHTVVAPLRSEDRILGAIGLSRPKETISPDDYQVLSAIGNQLGVALTNISNHQRVREALTSLQAVTRNLQTYIELATDAQEEERKRLSRELHDDILQSLVVAKAQIESAAGHEAPEQSRSRLRSAQDVLGDAIVNVRRYCHDLRPSLLDDLGLADAIDWLVGDLRARTGLGVDLIATGVAQRLSRRDELLIFRIVQEALHNVERHSKASRVRVSLAYAEVTLTVCVSDDGRGMSRSSGQTGRELPDPGLGLRGMHERTKLLRGTLTFGNPEGGGTELTLEVPLPGDISTGFDRSG